MAQGGEASAESYIGSLISVLSKSEIRYEGVVCAINTEESSIGLRNVRSFGTEGRQKDGPQVPHSDRIYEYILFRGSDIKDLKVKASAPVQSAPPIINDPAIIQSHYSHTISTPVNSLPPAPSGSLVDQGSHSSSNGLPSPAFQIGLPLWAPSPANPNGGGLAMPMYCQGSYGPPNVMPQQTLLPPPSFLSVPPSMAQMQSSGFSSSSFETTAQGLPASNSQDKRSSLFADITSSSSITPTLPASTFSVNMPSLAQFRPFGSETMNNQLQNLAPVSSSSTSTPISSFPSLAHLYTSLQATAELPSIAGNGPFPSPASLPQLNFSEPRTSLVGIPPSHVPVESLTPSLVTPGQLLQSGKDTVSASQPLQTAHDDFEVVVQASPKHSPEPSAPVAAETRPPLLPLPPNSRAHKPNGTGYNRRSNYRGRGGRRFGMSPPVTKFAEDFDFTAMNEKFDKDEVWGHLGKKSESKDEEGSGTETDSYDSQDEDLQNVEIKAVYNKDDFFDSISSNALKKNPNRWRTKYSEQMKLDAETFGDLSLSRYRGGRGYNRGRVRFRGSCRGRGGYDNRGRGGRSRGRDMQNDS